MPSVAFCLFVCLFVSLVALILLQTSLSCSACTRQRRHCVVPYFMYVCVRMMTLSLSLFLFSRLSRESDGSMGAHAQGTPE